MNTSNKLLLGLLLTILLFATVVVSTARFHAKKGKFVQEHASPPTAPYTPTAPEAPAPTDAE